MKETRVWVAAKACMAARVTAAYLSYHGLADILRKTCAAQESFGGVLVWAVVMGWGALAIAEVFLPGLHEWMHSGSERRAQ